MRDSAEHNTFYADLVRRNAGIISAGEQRLLRSATIVVAGCGSVGGAAVEALVRLGAEHLRLAEPSIYELGDLNRQRAGLADVGVNKGTALARRAHMINPYAHVEVLTAGVDSRSAESLLTGADVVLDAIDTCHPAALRPKAALHEAAALARVPVVAGHSVAGRQTILTSDYRRHGHLQRWRRLRWSSLPSPVPYRTQVDDTPRVVYMTDVLGALATCMVVDLLAGRSVRRRVVLDIHRLSRRWPDRMRDALICAADRRHPA